MVRRNELLHSHGVDSERLGKTVATWYPRASKPQALWDAGRALNQHSVGPAQSSLDASAETTHFFIG